MIKAQTLNNSEQIIREVKVIGNGAHIFTPRDWVGEEVFVIRTRKGKKSLKDKILSALDSYLENIEGVYLYGSYARGEAEKGSDIDLLVISNKKMKIIKEGFEIICLSESEMNKAIKISPVLIYSILAEAKPIINSTLLMKIKKEFKPSYSDFADYLEETGKIIIINEELLDPYSIMLRLRGIFIINAILQNEAYSYSNKSFISWISNEIADIDLKRIYNYYNNIKRNNKKEPANLKDEDLHLLLDLLKKQIQIIEISSNGKKRKKA